MRSKNRSRLNTTMAYSNYALSYIDKLTQETFQFLNVVDGRIYRGLRDAINRIIRKLRIFTRHNST